ncbi:hypothetical protein OUZ56_014517 [Daphnia magna]|uniref:Uncharacterized protein n=1 Tax=Daphnia magna TaxID=35525 RepID=A0ABR0AK65_9CRUS|nr:hypothetical protein OUZ56_014517 [Daphnia magna]
MSLFTIPSCLHCTLEALHNGSFFDRVDQSIRGFPGHATRAILVCRFTGFRAIVPALSKKNNKILSGIGSSFASWEYPGFAVFTAPLTLPLLANGSNVTGSLSPLETFRNLKFDIQML